MQRTPKKHTGQTMNYESDTQVNYSSPRERKPSEDSEEALILRRAKRKKPDGSSSDVHSAMSKMQNMFERFELQQNKKMDLIVDSITEVKEQNTEIKSSIEFLSNKYDEVLERVSTLESENSELKTRLAFLENKLEDVERNSRSSTIELRNIPTQQAENKDLLHTIVKNLGQVIEQPVQESDLQDVIRIKQKQTEQAPIIVKFTTTELKENFIKKCRIFNKENKENKLSTSHLKISGRPRPIFIGESLTANNKKLYYLARKKVTEKTAHSCWTNFGRIYIKLKENSNPVRIDCVEDFKKLPSKTF